MYRLLISDLDGTMLNDQNEIPASNREYIRKAAEAGVQFALCSGRSYISLANFEKALDINKSGYFGICFNGSIVYDAHTHEILRDERIEFDLVMEIIEKLKTFNVDIVIYDGDLLIAERTTDNLLRYSYKSKIPLTLTDSFLKINKSINKILVKSSYEILTEIEKELVPFVKGRANSSFTAQNLFEFSALTADKGQGILFLAKHLNIPISEVIAVGDHLNDIQMIKTAGLGIAVKNAREELKHLSNYVCETDNNEGVIKEIVQRFILK